MRGSGWWYRSWARARRSSAVKVMIRMTGPLDTVPRAFPVGSLHLRTPDNNLCQKRTRRVYQRHQLVQRREVGIGCRGDRDGLEPLGQLQPAEVLEDDGEEAPAGEGGGGVFNGDGRSVLGVRSRAGHRPLRDDQRGEMLRYLDHQGPMLPLATPPASWAYKPSLAECLCHTA